MECWYAIEGPFHRSAEAYTNFFPKLKLKLRILVSKNSHHFKNINKQSLIFDQLKFTVLYVLDS